MKSTFVLFLLKHFMFLMPELISFYLAHPFTDHTVCESVCQSFSHVQLFATPWTVVCWAPLSMGLSRQEYWSGLPFPSPGIVPTQGQNSGRCTDSLPSESPGKSLQLQLFLLILPFNLQTKFKSDLYIPLHEYSALNIYLLLPAKFILSYVFL